MSVAERMRKWMLYYGKHLHSNVARMIDELIDENTRLLKGEFTEDEFQNLCHNMTVEDADRFKAGCEAYQRKLFGRSDATEKRCP